MESKSDPTPLVVIVGETASGKSSLALEIARKCNGEIIAADSRTVYKQMDIGTAKPSHEDRRLIAHHLLDIVSPDQNFTAADFKGLAQQAIQEIASRGKLPILVGGSGLYIDAVLFDFQFSNRPDLLLRQRLQSLSVEALQQELIAADIPLPINSRNPRHLIRQIETGGVHTNDRRLRRNTLIVGLAIERVALAARVEQRVHQMIADGLESEVRALCHQYDWEAPGMQSIGYHEWQGFFEGKATISEVAQAIVQNTLKYAKRQRTWFRRNKSIQWTEQKEETVDLVTTFLNKSSIYKY